MNLEVTSRFHHYLLEIRKPLARDLKYISSMKTWVNLFTKHPASVGESWGQHALAACSFAWSLQLASLAAFVHALLPFLFVKTASARITSLYGRMVTHRSRPMAAGTSVPSDRAN